LGGIILYNLIKIQIISEKNKMILIKFEISQ
jgi:hypothetical protein